MLFTSLEFLFLFFPLVMGINYILPKAARNWWLTFASLFFYAWGEPKFLLVMLASILFNYLMALAISRKSAAPRIKKLLLALTAVGNLGVLFVFKYMNFVTSILNSISPSVTVTAFVLPIGISFFTFQAMSYVIDVYRGVPVQKNIVHLGLYISLFPQLIAGPIVRYTTVADEIKKRTVTPDMLCRGMIRFVKGFNKKVLLANLLALAADTAFAAEELSVVMVWLGAICYTLQIFFDFSGYSEMAIGIGLMLGFNFLENFDFPYVSKTVTEFWRRWHISLGSWFRDYLYFPLGGSRVKSRLRLVFNLAVVWLATGIWHGASWNFILWGVLYGVIIIVEKLLSIPKKVDTHPALRAIYQPFTLLTVILGWVMFRATDLPSAFAHIGAMFGAAPLGFCTPPAVFELLNYLAVIIIGILCSTPLFSFLGRKISERFRYGEAVCTTVHHVVQLLLFVVSVSFIVMDAHNPFIYFNF